MKRIIFLTTLLIPALGLTVSGPPARAADSVAVLKNFIKINAVKYRRADAESAAIGSIGEKRSPFAKVPRFYKQFPWRSGTIKIKQVAAVTLSSSQTNSLGGEATTVTATGTKISGGVSGSGSVDARYKLVKLEFNDKFEVVDRLNADSKAINRIKTLKSGKVRIVSAVWVLVYGTETQTSKISGNLKAEQSDTGGAFSLSKSGNVTFSFSPGSVMAYEISKFEWDHKKKKKRKNIKRLKTDKVWR